MRTPQVTDETLEHMIGALLRTGVMISGSVVALGGILYLSGHGNAAADFHTFKGQPEIDRVVGQIVKGAIALRARSIIQFGIVLLIATPIARVVLALIGFAFERDRTYIIITMIVLAVLLYSVISGAVQG